MDYHFSYSEFTKRVANLPDPQGYRINKTKEKVNIL